MKVSMAIGTIMEKHQGFVSFSILQYKDSKPS